MTKAQLINGIGRAFHNVALNLRKHSPSILIGMGVAGTVASTVLACKATTKLEAVLNEGREKINTITDFVESPDKPEDYTAEDYKKDKAMVTIKTGVEVAKLYAPSVLLGMTSLGCILTSHGISTKRIGALAAAYTTVDHSFKKYRKNVVERFGSELDKELRFGIKKKEVEETIVKEDGSTEVVKKTVDTIDAPFIDNYSEFARCYDVGCKGWTKDAEYNLMYVKQVQDHFNDILKLRGHVFLNEVYDAFGFQRTQAGQILGWVYNEVNPKGDNFIDFGLYDIHNPNGKNFVNGLERSVWLDFNIDGPIYDLLK